MMDHLIKSEEKISLNITAESVHPILQQKMLVDGFDLVLDLKRSHGLNIVDEKTG